MAAPWAALGSPVGGFGGSCEDSAAWVDEEAVSASLGFFLGSNSLALETPGVVLGMAPPDGGVVALVAGPRIGEMDD